MSDFISRLRRILTHPDPIGALARRLERVPCETIAQATGGVVGGVVTAPIAAAVGTAASTLTTPVGGVVALGATEAAGITGGMVAGRETGDKVCPVIRRALNGPMV